MKGIQNSQTSHDMKKFNTICWNLIESLQSEKFHLSPILFSWIFNWKRFYRWRWPWCDWRDWIRNWIDVVLQVLNPSSICLIYHFSKFTSSFRLTKWSWRTFNKSLPLYILSLPASKINNLVIQITIQIVKQGLKFWSNLLLLN